MRGESRLVAAAGFLILVPLSLILTVTLIDAQMLRPLSGFAFADLAWFIVVFLFFAAFWLAGECSSGCDRNFVLLWFFGSLVLYVLVLLAVSCRLLPSVFCPVHLIP